MKIKKKFKKLLKKLQSNRYLLPALMIVFAVTFLVSAGILVKRAIDDRTQNRQNDHLAGLVQQVPVKRPPISSDGPSDTYEEPLSAFVEIPHPVTGETIKVLREYAPVFQLNPDMVGWISLPETKLNYPVVQTTEEPDYYLKRDFYKNSSRYGTVYAHAWADLNTPSDNVTLYGHNMNDGSMFAALHEYESKEFYDANPCMSTAPIRFFRFSRSTSKKRISPIINL